MDTLAVKFVIGAVAFIGLLVGGILITRRRTARRVAEARVAGVVRDALLGPMINRRMLAWFVPTGLFALAAGALTSKNGPIAASSVWFAVLLGVVLVVGMVGAVMAGMRPVGIVELNRDANTLRFKVGESERTFDLSQAYDLAEQWIIPRQLYPTGGTGISIGQSGQKVSFWYLKRVGAPEEHPLIASPLEELRCRELGPVIHEHVRRSSSGQRDG